MSDYPVRKAGSEIDEPVRRETIEKAEPARAPFGFSFHYSYREITNLGGQVHVRSKDTRYQNGKLESEEFEGTTAQSFYEVQSEIQRRFLRQMTSLLHSIPFFLPFRGRDK